MYMCVFVSMDLCVGRLWREEKRPPQSSCLHGGFTFPSVVLSNRWLEEYD